MSFWFPRPPRIVLGSYWTLLGRRTVTLTPHELRSHAHVLGKTGSGKSYFLASLFLSLFRAKLPATLLDPHGDLAELVLAQLVAGGDLETPAARSRLVYLDLPEATRQRRFLPFNYMNQPYSDHEMAEHVAEAIKRAWPELATGAPTFENILKHGVICLRQNGLPLTRLSDLLTHAPFRNACLARVSDPQVLRFFTTRFDQWGKDAALMRESTLNRVDLLTLSPVLRYGLGASDNALRFRELIDSGRSLIINLAVPSPDTRRLVGSLLTVGMETAALSRADVPAFRRETTHHLLIDEFSQFMAQSEEALTRMLSETRKYNLFCVMAHQNWSQASERLKGALQNVGIEVILKTGRADAEYSARILGSVDPMTVKHVVRDENASERTHPTYLPMAEQWEKQVQAIQALRIGQAFIRLPNDQLKRVTTPRLPQLPVDKGALAKLKAEYLETWFQTNPPDSAPDQSPSRHGVWLSRRSRSQQAVELTRPSDRPQGRTWSPGRTSDQGQALFSFRAGRLSRRPRRRSHSVWALWFYYPPLISWLDHFALAQ